jgi:hypothetical protein
MVRAKAVFAFLSIITLLTVTGCIKDRFAVEVPEDLRVRSDYFGATVSPIYQYDYFISLSASTLDTISFAIGSSGGDQPIWVEVFETPGQDLITLYDLMRINEIFRSSWDTLEDPPVGGSKRQMQGIAKGEAFSVPSHVVDTDSVDPVYAEIDSLVPSAVWDSLWARRDRYIRDHGGL